MSGVTVMSVPVMVMRLSSREQVIHVKILRYVVKTAPMMMMVMAVVTHSIPGEETHGAGVTVERLQSDCSAATAAEQPSNAVTGYSSMNDVLHYVYESLVADGPRS